jgi:uncharacterized protein YerC
VSVTYKIDANRRIIWTKCVGLVRLQEVIDHFRTLEQDADCPDFLDVFLDLSEVESIPETRQISTVINEMNRIRGQVRFGACAILASRDALVGMMRVFEVMAENCFRVTCTFRVANEAEAWLVSQQSLADHKPDRAG